MASLTEVSIISRRVIRYGTYLIIFLIVGRFAFGVGKDIYKRLFPPPPEPPNPCFGPLTKLPFPEVKKPEQISYNLETPEGSLPEFPLKMNVYFMPQYTSGVQDERIARQKALSLNFDPSGKRLHENLQNVYIFEKKNSPSNLTMNIINGVFSISYDIVANPSSVMRSAPPQEDAQLYVTGILEKATLLPDDLTGLTTYDYLRYENSKFVPAVSLSEANLTKVNIFRKTFEDKYPSVTPKMREANIWFLIGGNSQENMEIIAGEYKYFPLDESKICTYPLKTPDQAWEDLKNNKGAVIDIGVDQKDTITIRKVYLAYFDAGQYVQYYQPVVVFEGDNNFVAYVPAVTDEFYGEEPEKQ